MRAPDWFSAEKLCTAKNAKGAKTWGPSGAVPWSSPTLDLEKNVLYVGTGVNYSQPPTNTSDAILAFDMGSGRLLWSRRLQPGIPVTRLVSRGISATIE